MRCRPRTGYSEELLEHLVSISCRVKVYTSLFLIKSRTKIPFNCLNCISASFWKPDVSCGDNLIPPDHRSLSLSDVKGHRVQRGSQSRLPRFRLNQRWVPDNLTNGTI